MRKSVVPRIFGLAGLYGLIFIGIVTIQFAKKGGFSLQVGNLLVSGQRRTLEEGEVVPYAGADPLMGETVVTFGGLEFRLAGENSASKGAGAALYLTDEAGNRYTGVCEYLVVEEDGLRFYMAGGADLFFSVAEDGTELRIGGNFHDEMFTGLELPYRPLKSSRVRDAGTGQFAIIAEGRNYQFNRAGLDNRQVLTLQKGGIPITYGVVGEEREFIPENYILAEARETGAYREALLHWVDRNYALWGQVVASRNDEDVVIAFGGEALSRGSYKSALAAVSQTFLSSSRRTYESSVFLGNMTTAQRGFIAEEAEYLARLSRGIDENFSDFLLEYHGLEYLAIRGHESLVEKGISLLRGYDPASLTLEQIPGLLEAVTGQPPREAEALTSQGCAILSRRLQQVASPAESHPLILVVQDGRADTVWNLRLGKALADWGDAAGQRDWAAIGRSIVLSVLSLEDEAGLVPALLSPGEPTGDQGPVSAARLYRLLMLGNYRPRAMAISPTSAGMWAWTASPDISVAQEGAVMDIAVTFPVGESHYLLIRGVKPFYRLQFYDMDWRTDPQFERYDSSGWMYYTRDQILVLKVKHRATVEHIRLYMGSPPPPPPPPPVETPSVEVQPVVEPVSIPGAAGMIE
jgi:hypothetical protein